MALIGRSAGVLSLAVLLAGAPIAGCDPPEPPESEACARSGKTLFYIDRAEATLADYEACVASDVCTRLPAKVRAGSRLLLDALGTKRAQRYCVWAGKRLAGDSELALAIEQEAFEAHSPAGVRCAADSEALYRPPYRHLQQRPQPPPPAPPTPEQLATFRNVRHEEKVREIKKCGPVGKAGHRCRDAVSYVSSNERFRSLFSAPIRNLGGGYVGVGSDQAYDFVSEARSEWAWLIDYDPVVVSVHLVARAVILRSPTPGAFVAAYSKKNRKRTRRWIRRSLVDTPSEIRLALGTFARYREKLYAYYKKYAKGPLPASPTFGWLAHEDHYRYIRLMYRQGRILIRRGNLLTDVVLPDIARSARQLGVQVRVYYDSNAADMWPLTEQYRQNLCGLPVDDDSVFMRTQFADKLGIELDGGRWIYVVHGARHLRQTFLREKPEWLRNLYVHGLPTPISERLTFVGMPQARLEPGALESMAAISAPSECR